MRALANALIVIGNSAYRHAPALANPKNDAEATAANFEVNARNEIGCGNARRGAS